jgi:hypothetical protein
MAKQVNSKPSTAKGTRQARAALNFLDINILIINQL